MPKVLLILAVICFCTNDSEACSNPTLTGPERLCLDGNGFYLGSAKREDGCGLNPFQGIEIITKPANSNPVITKQNDEGNDIRVKFDRVGTYVLRYTFRDEDGCGVPACTKDVVTEVFLPSAEFVEESIFVCKDDFLNADIHFTNATNARVEGPLISRNISGVNNGIGTYISDLPITESLTLKITKVDFELSCSQTSLFDSINIIALDKPSVKFIEKDCNAEEEYSMTYELEGGDGTYTLISTDIGTLSGNILTTNHRPSGEEFTIVFNSGPTCGEVSINIMEECDCTSFAGVMEDKSLVSCASDAISVVHDKTDLSKRPFDSIIYVLHTNPEGGIGDELDKSYSPIFNLPSAEFADSQLYVSAVVGPFTIEDFDISNEGLCKDISFGAPVKWFSNDDFSISGKLEVCANEMNRMYTIIENEPIKQPSFQFWEASQGSGAVLGSQNSERIFLSFPSATSNSTLYYHSDFRPIDGLLCRTTDSIEISVDGTVSAPPESEIILWPGNIFASTSDGPCYQWGFVSKFGDFVFNQIPGENEKYFYSDENISQSLMDERGYFVAIYDTPNCDFSLNNCNSIVFYNKNLNPNLSESDIDDFSLNISPNPNNGAFRIELKGSYKGEYRIEVISDIGQRIAEYNVNKLYDRSIKDIQLSHLPDGMYIIAISNKFGKREVIKTIITK